MQSMQKMQNMRNMQNMQNMQNLQNMHNMQIYKMCKKLCRICKHRKVCKMCKRGQIHTTWINRYFPSFKYLSSTLHSNYPQTLHFQQIPITQREIQLWPSNLMFNRNIDTRGRVWSGLPFIFFKPMLRFYVFQILSPITSFCFRLLNSQVSHCQNINNV